MEDINKQISELSNMISAIKVTLEQNNINCTKIFSYILNKIDDIESRISTIESSQTNSNDVINDTKSELETLQTDIQKSKDIIKTNNDNFSRITATINSRLDDIESKCLDTNGYVIIDKSNNTFEKLNKIKKFFYVVFHYRKIKKAEQEAIRKQEEAKRLEEQRKIEEQKRLEKEKEENKIKTRNEIKNILKQTKK